MYLVMRVCDKQGRTEELKKGGANIDKNKLFLWNP